MTAEEFIAKKEKQFKENSLTKVKDIGRDGKHFFIREAWSFLRQSNLPEKVFIVERLRKDSTEGSLSYDNWKKGDIEYRIGYFIVSQYGRTKGKWVWGQFCPFIPEMDLKNLLKKAEAEGTLT